MFTKLGNALIDSDRVLAIRPQVGERIGVIEITFDNGERIAVIDPDPLKAVEIYLAEGLGSDAFTSFNR